MAFDLLRAIFNFGIAEHMVTMNPCIGVKTGTSGIRETILEDATDYARLFETLDKMERELRIAQPAADAIRLVALTGCRRGEAAKLRWRHVERGRIVLPPASHKTGKRTGKRKIITLPAEAQAIIARQPERGRRLCLHSREGRGWHFVVSALAEGSQGGIASR